MIKLQQDSRDSGRRQPNPEGVRTGALARLGPPYRRLEGEKVFLRSPRQSDWPAWSELREASRDFLEAWEPTWSAEHLTKSSFRRRLRHYGREKAVIPFLIFARSDERLVGGVTMSNIRRSVSQTCSLGYWMGEPYIRRGYMSESLRAVIEFAFDDLGLHRIEAACLPANEASKRLLCGCGFREEGLAREYLKINGRWQDHILFALVATDPRP